MEKKGKMKKFAHSNQEEKKKQYATQNAHYIEKTNKKVTNAHLQN